MTDFALAARLPDPIWSDRLVLRRPAPEDAAAIARLGNNEKVHAMVSVVPHPYTEEMAARFVREKTRTESDHVFTMLTRDEDVIGVIALHDRPIGVEIGYWLGEPYWGDGYASEAVQALAAAADQAGIAALAARVMSHNLASRRVLEKTGFSSVGELRENCGPHADVLMTIYERRRPQ